ncbi:ankyrin repeat domain-containing protein [Streptomyces sp. KLOTTS4A1]|uniref:ankyrin repeat domain-containing protein n=1 Tax=Streptomyces sp. KLOTTS4A1 TaxID=3390996 RepID=UPI0039F4F264
MQNHHTPDQSAESALFAAVFDGDETTALRLLRSGADPDAADEDGATLLYLAAMTNRPGLVRLLLAAGADPARLSSGADLPLCGAACAGHHEAVRALLAAGAAPDQAEEGGFTALAWAVQLGHADTAGALLAAGADPERPGPDGVTPLVSAVRRGSLGCVKALLAQGARPTQEALSEAWRWLAADVEAVLRAEVAERAGPGELFVRRVPEYGGITVCVEVLRADGGGFGREQQTGHGAIATILEQTLRVRSPFGELLDRALPSPSSHLLPQALRAAGTPLRRGDSTADPENENWREAAQALADRADEATYQAAAALSRDASVLRRAFAADVLGRLSVTNRAYAGRALGLLVRVAEGGPGEFTGSAEGAVLARTLVRALGEPGDPSAVGPVLRFAHHPDPAVRAAVATALHSLTSVADMTASDTPGSAHTPDPATVLARLTSDTDPVVRHRATRALSWYSGDTLEVRESLAARLADSDPATVAEAARGLAVRGDPRAVPALSRLLTGQDPASAAYGRAVAAVEEVRDERARAMLRGTFPRIGA